ncbi:response regulator [Niveispirillum sp. KHB5.9]|uniref:response regulator n=1 Tax=Niveispirillum sp. KHB5.9 TaxID=3400269 RepID=UPI003A8876CE
MAIKQSDKVNILLVDDQPAKLMSYEVILRDLDEHLLKANSAREALEHLLRHEVAVVLIDVCMPELDGFELAAMIREHPRFQDIAIIFVSAIQVADLDRLRGYQAGAVDYVPVPVVPEVLRAKVRIFAELFRKTRQLERLNAELELRVKERTAALEASNARLTDSEQRRTLAMAAGRMGSWDWDVASGICAWDEGQFRLYGLEPGAFVPNQESIAAFIHPDDRQLVHEASWAAVKAGQPLNTEFRIRHADGSWRWCVSIAAVSPDAGGGPTRLCGITYDVTERKNAEHALRTLNDDLERRIEERTREREHALAQLFEAQKMDTIGQLTGGMAHDFNNLLMAILGSLELMKKWLPPDDARILRLLDNARQAAERGSALTQRLLAFARRQELKPEAVDVSRLVGGIEDLLQRALGQSVRIAKSLPNDLPPVCVDANQLELALLNLAVNARDAMPVGGVLGVAAKTEEMEAKDGLRPGAYVRITVSDSGIGMDADTLARATEPFFTTKGPGKGTGLGLSMVHGLAAQSGGRLKLSSKPGKGTTIDLWLPRAEVILPTGEVVASLGGVMEGGTILPRSVLLVDDDTLVNIGTAAMLEDLGHNVVSAHSGAEALEIMRSGQHIDIVITDHAMPGMTGMELARHLRRMRPDMPIILASGFAELPQGPDEVLDLPRLAKPYRQEDLAASLLVVLGQSPTAPNVIPLWGR